VDHLSKRNDDLYVILKERGGKQHLEIPIGEAEAFAIDAGHRRINFRRPMTHDFIADLVRALGEVTLDRAVVTEIRGEIYFAELRAPLGPQPNQKTFRSQRDVRRLPSDG
jgi:bifunctional DNase/RNase